MKARLDMNKSAPWCSASRRLSLPCSTVLSRRFHVVMGKGGVGKSTVAMTLGLHFAQSGLRTLICEVDDREMMTYAFQVPASHSEVRSLQKNLSVVSIDTQSALSEYGVLKLKVKALSSLLTENPLTRALISIVPGVADLIALGKAFNHERQPHPTLSGVFKWDRIIVDAPSTGHGLTFLRLPQVIREVVPSGNMRREADDMWSLIANPDRSSVHVVSTPEELPIQEAKELWCTLENELKLTPQALWCNKVNISPFTEKEWREVSLKLEEGESSQWLSRLLRGRQSMGEGQLSHLSKLDVIKGTRAYLPQFPLQDPVTLKETIVYALEALRESSKV